MYKQPSTKRRKLDHSSSSFDLSASPSVSSSLSKNVDNDDSSTNSPAGPSDVSPLRENCRLKSKSHSHADAKNGEGYSKMNSNYMKPKVATSRNGVYESELYHSNLFKLQVDDLLKSVSVGQGKLSRLIERDLRDLKKIIEQTEDRPPRTVPEAEQDLKKAGGVIVPFPEPHPDADVKYKLEFKPPSAITVVGGFASKHATKIDSEIVIDLAVTMPAAILQVKDYLNYRYFYKRAYYLACLAISIRESRGNDFEIYFDSFNDNELQPTLFVKPKSGIEGSNNSHHKYRIQILVTYPDGTFPPEKSLPSRNSIHSESQGGSASEKSPKPTPFYNASLRSDCLSNYFLKNFNAASILCRDFDDACILSRIWLRQRGFSGKIGDGGFGGFEFSYIMASLLNLNGRAAPHSLSPGYSSYQLLKATLQFVSTRDLIKMPFFSNGSPIALPRSSSGPIFFDNALGVNVLFKMTPWSYEKLRHESRVTVQMLGESNYNQFESAFITKASNELLQYDLLISATLGSLRQTDTPNIQDLCHKIYKILERGLTDRVSLVSLIVPRITWWSLNAKRDILDDKARLKLGIMFNVTNAFRTMDYGPHAENKEEAASFRQFWGEKAELRRFKDGTISESLMWDSKDAHTSVVEQIVNYLFGRHLSKEAQEIAVCGQNFHQNLGNGARKIYRDSSQYADIMKAFASLEQQIRGLPNIPLSVRHVLGTGPGLYYSSINVPMSGSGNNLEPADFVLEFEGSGRWPDDLAAIQRTKIAFLLKIGELLRASVDGILTRVGLENQSNHYMNQAFLVILHPSGFIFRMRIRLDREETLLMRMLKDPGIPQKTKGIAAQSLTSFRRDLLRITAHAQAFQTLCTRISPLSPSVRLVKYWFASHLLDTHIPNVVIELLVARTFLHPYPWDTPSSANTALLRTLHFLSRWDWRRDPLIVDFGGAMSADDLAYITTKFDAWRKLDPEINRVALFAASSADPDGATHTDGSPTKLAAARMTALARAACAALAAGGLETDPSSLFTPSLAEYDFLIHLDPKFTARGRDAALAKSSRAAFKNLQLQLAPSERDLERAGFDPVAQFVAELRGVYGQAFVLFWDGSGGDVLAGLWNPALDGRAWKVKLGFSSVPAGDEVGGDVFVNVNREGILSEVARLGGELIKRIEVTSPLKGVQRRLAK